MAIVPFGWLEKLPYNAKTGSTQISKKLFNCRVWIEFSRSAWVLQVADLSLPTKINTLYYISHTLGHKETRIFWIEEVICP